MTEHVEIRFPIGDARVVLTCQCGAEVVLDPTKQILESGGVSVACPVSNKHSIDSATVRAAWHFQQAIAEASAKKQVDLIVRKN